MQQECMGLVRDLWAQGISADLLHESMEMDNVEDIQKFCRENKIPHIVILGDKALFFERKQVSLNLTFDPTTWAQITGLPNRSFS